jgi:hypothetical protein
MSDRTSIPDPECRPTWSGAIFKTATLKLDNVGSYAGFHLRGRGTWDVAGFTDTQEVTRFIPFESDGNSYLKFPFSRCPDSADVTAHWELIGFRPVNVPSKFLSFQYFCHIVLAFLPKETEFSRSVVAFHESNFDVALDPVISCFIREYHAVLPGLTDVDSFVRAHPNTSDLLGKSEIIREFGLSTSPNYEPGRQLHALVIESSRRPRLIIARQNSRGPLWTEISGNIVTKIRDKTQRELVEKEQRIHEKSTRSGVPNRLWFVQSEFVPRGCRIGPLSFINPYRPVRIYQLNTATRVPEFRGFVEFRSLAAAHQDIAIVPYHEERFPFPFAEVFPHEDNSFLLISIAGAPKGPHQLIWVEQWAGVYRPMLVRGSVSSSVSNILTGCGIPDEEMMQWVLEVQGSSKDGEWIGIAQKEWIGIGPARLRKVKW